MASFSPKDKHNFQCVTEASLELIKLPLKDILLSQIKPEDLFIKIQSSSLLSGRNKLRQDQLNLCYFPPPVLPDYSKFDVTLLYTLIRNVCPGLQPTRGWGNEPSPNDTTIGDDIERLRLFRNRSFAHRSSASISDDTFEDLWKTLKSVFNRLKSQSGCTVDYEQELIEIKRSKFTYDKWDTCKTLLNAYMKIEEQTDEREVALVEPSIWMKGKEEVICGDTAEFEAEVKQTENFCLPIIWQRRKGKAVEIIDTNLEKYSGSTNTKLVIPSVRKEDAWEYQASVSRESNGNRITVLSNTIYLHVFGEMPFLNDLQVTTEDEGITIHYSFGVSENSPQVKNIIWSKNGQPMYIKYDKFIGGSLHDGFLVIKSPSEDDIGKYACTVTNAVGSKTKDIVLGVPCVAISIKPTVHFASKASITSIVTSMPQPEKAQWQNSKNGNNFSELDVTKSKYFGSNVSPECPLLVIPKTTFDDNLYYRLQISNKLGVNVSNIVNLKVTGSLPNISISHETDIINRSIKLSGAVFLLDDSPGIQDVFWSKNGEKIDIQGSGGRLSGVTKDDPSLTIRDVSQEDVGKYQLTARNAIGTNTSDVISIDAPYLNIRSEKNGTGKNDCICFTVEITSTPSPCHAQWNIKSKGDETFTALDVNSEQYQGSTNSLPHPTLVVLEKDQLEKNIYQIKVTNFVGSTVKEVSGDQSKPVQEREENKLYRTTDADAKFRFANLCNFLAMQFPHEKLKHLKKLIHDTEQVEDLESLLAANSAMDCFLILQDENLFTRDDVIFMQYLCKQTQCGELYQKCKEYALNNKALCFIEIPPDNGYKEVQIHIYAKLDCYDGKEIQKIVKIVAAMLDCKSKDILVVDLRPSRSVILVLSIKEEYTWKFSALNEEDSQKLRKLKIDYLIVDKKTIHLETSQELFGRLPFQIIDKPSNVYRIHQCFRCPRDAEFFCKSCKSDLCFRCNENHTKDQENYDHNVVTYREKFNYIPKQEICVNHPKTVYTKYCDSCDVPLCTFCYGDHSYGLIRVLFGRKQHNNLDLQGAYKTKRQQCRGTMRIIRSEALFYRPLLLERIKADLKTCQKIFSIFQLDMLTKANKLKKLIDCVQNSVVNKMISNLDFKHRNLKHKVEMNRHLFRLQKYADIYEQSAIRPLHFLSSIKTARLSHTNLTLHTRQLSVTGSFYKEDVMVSLSGIHIKQRGNRRVENEYLLKLMPAPELLHCFTLTNIQYCFHISCVRSDDLVWVSGFNSFILTNTTGATLHRLWDLCNDPFIGSHTVNNKGELIYIDNNYNINHLSMDMKTTNIFIERTNFLWKPYSVYSSPSTGDLLVSMHSEGISKVVRYNQSGQLTQTIQHHKEGLGMYRKHNFITENNNGDVVVSHFGVVVVTERGGRHRFSYKGHQSRSISILPCGLCTDALSNILVCDGQTNTIQIINKNGQFLSYLLHNSLKISMPCGLSYDNTTHRLWVGSKRNNKIHVYKNIQRQNLTEDLYQIISHEEESINKIPCPEFHQLFTLTGVDGCDHISCVTSDQVWGSRLNYVFLTNTTSVTLHRLEDLGSEFGSHTVNNEGELIYIDRGYRIKKLSKDMKTTTTFTEGTGFLWKPQSVYCSPSTGDLLVGMNRIDKKTGKVARYNRSGQLQQIIQHDNKRLDLYRTLHYITENRNYDIVVSDHESGAVVVTERCGRHRFSYTGPKIGSKLEPWGICTDAMSQILVCDGITNMVQIIDMDGQFLTHLLIRQLETTPHSLSYDITTHQLWVGSRETSTVFVYRNTHHDHRMDITRYEKTSWNENQVRKIEQQDLGESIIEVIKV